MHLRSLSISTLLRVHPEFIEDPVMFALRHGVPMMDDIAPETSFKKKESDEKSTKVKANIHLVQYRAIRLFIERENDDDWWIQSIDLNPSLLLHGDKDHPLTDGDLVASLSILKAAVTPLLADPLDACHIVPGLVGDGKNVAYWREIETEVMLPDVDLRCLHDVSHPHTKPAQGSTPTSMRLGNDRDACFICFETASCEHTSSSGPGVRVRLSLRGHMLLHSFGQTGKTALVNNTKCLVTFRPRELVRVHQKTMSQLDGTYLPVPPGWADMGKPVTHAKAMALVSRLTSIPIEEILAMDDDLRQPSASTRKRLNNDVEEAAACLKPVPVHTLFRPEHYTTLQSEPIHHDQSAIDPLVAATYGDK